KKAFKICLMLSTFFGSENNYMAPVLLLGQSNTYKNQSLWLRLDLDDIPGLSLESNLKESFVIRKKDTDELIVLPVLERFLSKLSSNSKTLFKKNLNKITLNQQNFFEFIRYHQDYKYPFIHDLDPDATLYQDGFFSFQDKKQISFIHKFFQDLQSDFFESEILEKISSPRIKTLTNRLIYRNFKNKKWNTKDVELTLCLQKLTSSLKEDQITGYKNDIKFNRKMGLLELKEVEKEMVTLDDDTKRMLLWLKKYIKNL
ncbi:exodeoxyribonuclease I, partial [bacterium]|nr:exodeoxyribonuclease I [bacterium]